MTQYSIPESTQAQDEALVDRARSLLADKLRDRLRREAALHIEAAELSAELRMTAPRSSRAHKCFVDGFAEAIKMMQSVHTTDALAEFVENLQRRLDTKTPAR